jgi:2-polyprenyl-3-methyl-5-hydroxy-6-metoxy-1,4-benzoquinol methylase
MPDHPPDTRGGGRFSFGRNWRGFVDIVDEARIEAAIESLTGPLRSTDLSGRTFLDAGCGSGLFSLAAHRIGASVRSFDVDPACVAAAAELRRRFAPGCDWGIEQGSILDERFVHDLGRFDIVYSWGVAHHTGDLWGALHAAAGLVAAGGLLFVSVYNDQGPASRVWWHVKRRYNRAGPLMRRTLLAASAAYLDRHLPLRKLGTVMRGELSAPARAPRARGMSFRHDLVDWVGGYPFEVAKPEQVFEFLRLGGFDLRYLTTCAGGLGCNEYVFQRAQFPASQV